jgi:hypothetical protein
MLRILSSSSAQCPSMVNDPPSPSRPQRGTRIRAYSSDLTLVCLMVNGEVP